MVTGQIPALWLDLQVPNQHGRPANPHSAARFFRVRDAPLDWTWADATKYAAGDQRGLEGYVHDFTTMGLLVPTMG